MTSLFQPFSRAGLTHTHHALHRVPSQTRLAADIQRLLHGHTSSISSMKNKNAPQSTTVDPKDSNAINVTQVYTCSHRQKNILLSAYASSSLENFLLAGGNAYTSPQIERTVGRPCDACTARDALVELGTVPPPPKVAPEEVITAFTAVHAYPARKPVKPELFHRVHELVFSLFGKAVQGTDNLRTALRAELVGLFFDIERQRHRVKKHFYVLEDAQSTRKGREEISQAYERFCVVDNGLGYLYEAMVAVQNLLVKTEPVARPPDTEKTGNGLLDLVAEMYDK